MRGKEMKWGDSIWWGSERWIERERREQERALCGKGDVGSGEMVCDTEVREREKESA